MNLGRKYSRTKSKSSKLLVTKRINTLIKKTPTSQKLQNMKFLKWQTKGNPQRSSQGRNDGVLIGSSMIRRRI